MEFSARNSVDGPKKQGAINSGLLASKSSNAPAAQHAVLQSKVKGRGAAAEKIGASGKVVASSAAVKKPPAATKQLPNQASSISSNNYYQQASSSQNAAGQTLPGQHTRVKSDPHQSKKTKELMRQLGVSAAM